MKILMLSDNLDNWSCHNRCKAIKKFLPDHTIDIVQGWGKERQFIDVYKRYDIVHVQYMNRLHEFLPVVMQMGSKFLVTIANERGLLWGYGIEKDKVERMIRDKLCYFTSVSKRLADMYDIDYIPNGVDLSMFHSPKDVTIGFVGTAKENKGYPILKKVCEDLGVKLLALTYQDTQVPQEEMWEKYREMDCLIHPSITEGCNNVILEALAMNVPVYMTKQGIYHDLTDYVEFIEPDYDSISHIIKRYKGRNLINSSFKWESIVKEYEDKYNKILNR